MLKLVPFYNAWIDHNKLDLTAIYRRPRWTKDEFDQDVPERGPDGLPLWDLTGPLPVKQHNKWLAKGFEYVTLADRDSLIEAHRKGTLQLGPGITSVREYDQHQTGGPWNYKMYAAGQSQHDNAALLQLRENVQRYGSEAYQSIRREVDPTFTLPKELQGIEPGGALPPLAPAPKNPPKQPASAATTSSTAAGATETVTADVASSGRRRKGVTASGRARTKKSATKKEPVQA